MNDNELRVFLCALRDRPHPVASLLVLRQEALDPADEAFLLANVAALNGTDLARWLALPRRATPAPDEDPRVAAVARIAIEAPGLLLHEVLGAPGFQADPSFWSHVVGAVGAHGTEAARAAIRRAASGESAAERETPRSIADRVAPFGAGHGAAPSEVAFDDGGLLDPRALLGDLEGAADALLGGNGGTEADGTLVHDATLFVTTMGGEGSVPGHREEAPLENLASLEVRWRNAARFDERLYLLQKMEQRDLPRRRLLDLAIDTIDMKGGEGGGLDALVTGLLVRQLTTPHIWQRYGLPVIQALFSERAWMEATSLFTHLAAGSAPSETFAAAHAALGRTLVERCRIAASRKDTQGACVALAALVASGPSSRVARPIRVLADVRGLPQDAKVLIAAAERQMRLSRRRPPSLESVIAAIQVLAAAE